MRTLLLPLGNTNMAKDYIIDYGNNEDKSQWYRLWKSGFIEQGGYILTPTPNIYYTINLLLPYSSSNYTIITTVNNKNDNALFCNVNTTNQPITNSSFAIKIVHKSSSPGNSVLTYFNTTGY